ncbi:MAG TPA: hypothetical protein VKC53_00960 [Patescibacteria group bacterium]|nr:hypothetical protein [Patescibacteria group bacterium]
MAERIQIKLVSGPDKYTIRPINEVRVKDGYVAADDEFLTGFEFRVEKENRQVVFNALKELQIFLTKPHLAITDRRLNDWLMTIETNLIPPVLITGPEMLVRNEA